jgi:SAM-dependent methyltransferase
MDDLRKPFQGVKNIIRFNWHYYVVSVGVLSLLQLAGGSSNEIVHYAIDIICVLILLVICISLFASWYVYDRSGFYNLNWVKTDHSKLSIVNINAGFDETSLLLKRKFANAELQILDFYDPIRHTEISIKRARKIYPSLAGTQIITAANLPVQNNSMDKVFVTLAAHEIRNEDERVAFFKELKRIIKPGGEIYITEHLRDLANGLAYNIGFFHFYSKRTWKRTFEIAKLNIQREIKNIPLISTFILTKNGNTF